MTAPGALRQNLEEEENHLMKVFKENGYSHFFIRSACATRPPREHYREKEEDRPERPSTAYIAGITERTRRVCRDFNIRVVFKN